MKYKFINANIDLGTHVDGASKGANLISEHFKDYSAVNINQKNVAKDKSKFNKTKNIKAINAFNKELYNEVTNTIKEDMFPITIGGDHSLAIATALASNTINNGIGIIWVDAHADYNTIKSTVTGNIHGLPLAVINGHNKLRLSSFLRPKYIPHAKTVIVGARSIDKLEKINLLKDNITVYTTQDIHKYGVNKVMDMAFEKALNGSKKLHISYDLDVIDPNVCPGVSIPEKGGITEEDAYDIMKYIKSNQNYIKSLDLVEYNPNYDKNNKSLNIAVNLLNTFINDEKKY